MADFLFLKQPILPEGQLSIMRASLVDTSACFAYIQALELGQYVLLCKGEQQSCGRGKETILAAAANALAALKR